MSATARQYDRNGWFEIKRQPLSKAGVFPYLGKNIPGAPDPDKFYLVLRSAESLADPEFLDSLKLSPWIDEHTMLGTEGQGATPAEQKGVGGVIGEQVYFDSDDKTLYGNVKAFSEAHKNVIDSGKRELSLGYYSQYVWEAGEYEGQPYDVVQIPRYGNHLASVKEGRMGADVAVLDHLDKFTFTIDSKEFIQMAATKKKFILQTPLALAVGKKLRDVLVTVPTVDGKEKAKVLKFTVPTFDADEASAETEGAAEGDKPSEMTLDDALAALGALMPILEKFGIAVSAPAAPAKVDDPAAAVVTEDDDENKDDKDKKPAATMDAADIARTVRIDIAAANLLYGDVSKLVGTFDHSAMSEQQVAEYGVSKLELTCAKGAELPTLRGYLVATSKAPTVKVVSTTDAIDTSEPFYQKQLDERAAK